MAREAGHTGSPAPAPSAKRAIVHEIVNSIHRLILEASSKPCGNITRLLQVHKTLVAVTISFTMNETYSSMQCPFTGTAMARSWTVHEHDASWEPSHEVLSELSPSRGAVGRAWSYRRAAPGAARGGAQGFRVVQATVLRHRQAAQAPAPRGPGTTHRRRPTRAPQARARAVPARGRQRRGLRPSDRSLSAVRPWVGIRPRSEPRVIQQVDVEEVSLSIREHRGHAGWCPCRAKLYEAPLPVGIERGRAHLIRVIRIDSY
jgi:hypothetical protein